jgi:hypothetical protein
MAMPSFRFDEGNLRVEQIDDGSGLHLHTGLREMLVDELLMRVARRERDQCLALERGPCRCFPGLDVILDSSSHHQRETKERLATYVGHGLEYPQAHVELAGFHHLDQGRQVSIE